MVALWLIFIITFVVPKASFASAYLPGIVQSVIWVRVRKQWIFHVFYYVELGNEVKDTGRLLWSCLNLEGLKLKLPSEEMCFLLQGFFPTYMEFCCFFVVCEWGRYGWDF